MREEVERVGARIPSPDGLGEQGQIVDITAIIVDPHQRRIVDVPWRIAMTAMFKHAYGVPLEQEVPDQLGVFLREFREPV